MWEAIQPVVLVGGASRRFGRDKLREPAGRPDEWLVDRPIAALRAVFGPRVVAVGDCGPAVAARADLHVRDAFPGRGPLAGIVSAIEASRTDVFVLPGDAPGITPGVVRQLLAAADEDPGAWAVLGLTDRPEPCIGVYRVACAAEVRLRLESGDGALIDAVSEGRRVLVAIPANAARNVNRPEDLGRA